VMTTLEEINTSIRPVQPLTPFYSQSHHLNDSYDSNDSNDSDDDKRRKKLRLAEEYILMEQEIKLQDQRPISNENNENDQGKEYEIFKSQSQNVSTANLISEIETKDSTDNNKEFVICVEHTRPITSIAMSNDHRYIVTASLDRTCKILYKEEEEEERIIIKEMSIGNREYNNSFWSVKCAKEKNSQEEVVIAGDNSGRLHCWDLKTADKKWKSVKSGSLISQIIVHQNENQDLIVSAGGDNLLRLWDISSPSELLAPNRRPIETDCNCITSVCFNSSYSGSESKTSNDNYYTQIVLAGVNNTKSVIEVYDVNTSNKINSFEFLSVRKPYKIATSHCGQYALLTFLDSPLIYVFCLSNPAVCVRIFREQETFEGVLDLYILSDYVLIGCTNGMLEIWDWKNGTKFDSFCKHSSWVRALVFDDESKRVFSVGSDPSKIIVSWNLRLRHR